MKCEQDLKAFAQNNALTRKFTMPLGLHDLDPLNSKHPCTSHVGVYIGFCGNLNPADTTVLSYNIFFFMRKCQHLISPQHQPDKLAMSIYSLTHT